MSWASRLITIQTLVSARRNVRFGANSSKTMSAAQARRRRDRTDLLNDLCALDIRSVTGAMVASSSLGISNATHAHELDGMRPRRCHQRWLAESLPCIAEGLTAATAGVLVSANKGR